MPVRIKKLASPPAWRQIVHDLAGDLAAHQLLLTAIDRASDDAERSGHLQAARQLLADGETRLQALRQAVQRELAQASTSRRARSSSSNGRK